MKIEEIINAVGCLPVEIDQLCTFDEYIEFYKSLVNVVDVIEQMAIQAVTEASILAETKQECDTLRSEVYGGNNNLSLYTIDEIKRNVDRCITLHSSVGK